MHRLRPWLQLVRLPAVFTAMADIVLGFLLNHHAGLGGHAGLGILLGASSCLYLSGMAFNDYFDRERDAQERPNRPIPSGKISPGGAFALAAVLMMFGIGLSSVVANQSLIVAASLAACILAYDGLLKSTPLGPLAMGGCRFLNVMLGASAYDARLSVWTPPQLYIAAAMGIYVAGITWFARNEATTSRRSELAGAAVAVNVGILALGAFVMRDVVPALVPILARLAGPGSGTDRGTSTLVLLAAVLFTVNRRLLAALRDPKPAVIQQAVKVMLLSLVTLDAALIYFESGSLVYTLATLALLIPAIFLGRWIFIT